MTANMKDTNSTVMPMKHTTNTTTNLGAVIVPLPAELAARVLAFGDGQQHHADLRKIAGRMAASKSDALPTFSAKLWSRSASGGCPSCSGRRARRNRSR